MFNGIIFNQGKIYKTIKRAKGITLFLPKIKGCMTEAKQKGHTPDNHAAVIFA